MEKQASNKATVFKIRSGEDQLLIRVIDEYAFGRTFEKSLSAQWARALMTGEAVTVRLADRSPSMVPGTSVSPSSLERIAICFPAYGEVALGERDEKEARFALRCIASNETDQVRRDGKVIFEVDIFLFAKNHGSTDTFLVAHRGPLYVRVEK
jgi:hypothetical protein